MTQLSEGELALFPGERADNTPVLFFTNRYNLLEFLSSGLITPVAGIMKYYPDLLDLCPGRVPLVRGPLGANALRLVSDDDPSSFPVAFELKAAAASRSVPALTSEGPANLKVGEAGADAWAVGGVIPITAVAKVHFRSERELNEHLARGYENVPSEIVPMAVSPRLFDGSTGDAAAVTSWLGALPATDSGTPDAFQLADRIAGARALALIATPADPAFIRGVAALFGAKGKAATKRSAQEPFPRWLTLDALYNPEAQSAKGADLNEKLFRACVAVLQQTQRTTSWRPLEILGAVEQRVRSGKLNKKDEVELDRNVEPIRAILRNDRDFRPFKPNAGLDIAKALLMVLLRPDPTRLRAWSSADSGATETVELAAAVLAGYLVGYKRLPTSLRDPRWDRLIAKLQAEELNSNVEDAVFTFGDAAARLDVEDIRSTGLGGGVSIIWDGNPILTREAPPETAAEWLARVDPTAPEFRALVLQVCGKLGWADCIRTEVAFASGSFTTSVTEKGEIRILFAGIPNVTHDVVAEAFKRRLVAEGLPRDAARLVDDARGAVAESVART